MRPYGNFYLGIVKKSEYIYDDNNKPIDLKIYVKPLNTHEGNFSALTDDASKLIECNIMSHVSIDPIGAGAGFIARPHDGAVCLLWRNYELGEIGKDVIIGFISNAGNTTVGSGSGLYSVPEISKGGFIYRVGASTGTSIEFAKEGIKLSSNPLNSINVTTKGIQSIANEFNFHHTTGWFNPRTFYNTVDEWQPILESEVRMDIKTTLATLTVDKQSHSIVDMSNGEIYFRSALIDNTTNSVSYGTNLISGASNNFILLSSNLSTKFIYESNIDNTGFITSHKINNGLVTTSLFENKYDSFGNSYIMTLVDKNKNKSEFNFSSKGIKLSYSVSGNATAKIDISSDGINIQYKDSNVKINSNGIVEINSNNMKHKNLESVLLFDGLEKLWDLFLDHKHTSSGPGNPTLSCKLDSLNANIPISSEKIFNTYKSKTILN